MALPSHIPIHPILANALMEAFREIEAHPEDSLVDIVNESLSSWKTGLRMDHDFDIVPDPFL